MFASWRRRMVRVEGCWSVARTPNRWKLWHSRPWMVELPPSTSMQKSALATLMFEYRPLEAEVTIPVLGESNVAPERVMRAREEARTLAPDPTNSAWVALTIPSDARRPTPFPEANRIPSAERFPPWETYIPDV